MAKIDIPHPIGATVIAAVESSGTKFLKVRLWSAPDGFNYIPCADIAALYETMRRAPPEISGIGVKLVYEEKS